MNSKKNSTKNHGFEPIIMDFGNRKVSQQNFSKITFPAQALSVMVTAIRELQKFEARLKIISYIPAFKKTKQFEVIHLKLNNVWDEIFHLIAHQNDKNLIHELMLNFPYTRHIYAK